jgi:hypothetical protein
VALSDPGVFSSFNTFLSPALSNGPLPTRLHFPFGGRAVISLIDTANRSAQNTSPSLVSTGYREALLTQSSNVGPSYSIRVMIPAEMIEPVAEQLSLVNVSGG